MRRHQQGCKFQGLREVKSPLEYGYNVFVEQAGEWRADGSYSVGRYLGKAGLCEMEREL